MFVGLWLNLTALCIAGESSPTGEGADRFPTLTSLAQISDVPEGERREEHRVDIEITSLYYDPFWKLLWGNDGGANMYIALESASPSLKSGQRFRVQGRMVPEKGLRLRDAKITVLDKNAVIPVLSAKGRIEDVDRLNAHLATIEGYVNRQAEIDPTHLLLELDVEGSHVAARVLIGTDNPVPQVEGAFVRMKALYSGEAQPGTTTPKIDLWVFKRARHRNHRLAGS